MDRRQSGRGRHGVATARAEPPRFRRIRQRFAAHRSRGGIQSVQPIPRSRRTAFEADERQLAARIPKHVILDREGGRLARVGDKFTAAGQ